MLLCVQHIEVMRTLAYEAAAIGLAILRKDGWTPPVGSATSINVEVREPVTSHQVTVIQIQRWLQGATTSPNERVRKDRLRAPIVTKNYNVYRRVGA